jgi:hypothetical protein
MVGAWRVYRGIVYVGVHVQWNAEPAHDHPLEGSSQAIVLRLSEQNCKAVQGGLRACVASDA